jgi:ankyrin repeat protein
MAAKNLHSACEQLDLEAVTDLLSKGEDHNICDQYGQTPLHIAVDSEIDGKWQTSHSLEDPDFTIAKLLLNSGANLDAMDSNGETPIDWVASHGKEAISAFKIQVLDKYKNATYQVNQICALRAPVRQPTPGLLAACFNR